MSTFQEKLEAAKGKPPSTHDVQVTLDGDLAERREALTARLAQARAAADEDQRLAVRDETVEAIEAELEGLIEDAVGALVTLRFTRLPGSVWGEIADRCPARLDSPLDLQYGYNLNRAVQIACAFRDPDTGRAYAHLVEDGEPVELSEGEWQDLFKELSGHEFGMVKDAVYDLNVYGPAKRVAALKKASATRPA